MLAEMRTSSAEMVREVLYVLAYFFLLDELRLFFFFLHGSFHKRIGDFFFKRFCGMCFFFLLLSSVGQTTIALWLLPASSSVYYMRVLTLLSLLLPCNCVFEILNEAAHLSFSSSSM